VRLAVEAAMALAAVLWAASSRPRPAIAFLPILIAAAVAAYFGGQLAGSRLRPR
jgi:prepilin signal peptidase PulO-like enzyme (type II secretory pathway)